MGCSWPVWSGGHFTRHEVSFELHSLLEETVCCVFRDGLFNFFFVFWKINGAFSMLVLTLKYFTATYVVSNE